MKYSQNVATAMRVFTRILQEDKINKMETFRKLQDVADLLTDHDIKIINGYCRGDDEEMSPSEKQLEELQNLREIEKKYRAITNIVIDDKVISDCQPRE